VNQYTAIVEQTKLEIRKYGNEKGIIFIDPYGYKEINILDIKDLLKTKKTEILLFLPISFMYRFIKKINTEEELPYIEPLKKLLISIYVNQEL
jgi:three-Cys-motif partner protein